MRPAAPPVPPPPNLSPARQRVQNKRLQLSPSLTEAPSCLSSSSALCPPTLWKSWVMQLARRDSPPGGFVILIVCSGRAATAASSWLGDAETPTSSVRAPNLQKHQGKKKKTVFFLHAKPKNVCCSRKKRICTRFFFCP